MPSDPNEDFDFSEAPRPIAKRAVRHGSLEKAAREAGHSGRILVRITSFRRRLLDSDNPSGKNFTDCLRYSGLISDDNLESIEVRMSQVKVATKEEERTEIELTPIPAYEPPPKLAPNNHRSHRPYRRDRSIPPPFDFDPTD